MSTIDWLPEILVLSPWKEETFDALYDVFVESIKNFPLKMDGQEVWFFREVDSEGRELLFWHLTHRENKETGIRLPDFRRSERLPWVNPLIMNCRRDGVLCWDYIEDDKSIKTYIWLNREDFVIILKKYGDGRRRLITSYHIDYENKRRTLVRKYNNRIK